MDIDILDHLNKDTVILEAKAKNKKALLTCALEHLIDKKKVRKDDKKTILKALVQREEMGSTAIGGYIALPHARIDCVKNIQLCLLISPDGIDFDSLDDEPVNIIALLLSNQKQAGFHLKMLAFLARMLRDKYFVQQLKNAKDQTAVLALVNKQQLAVR